MWSKLVRLNALACTTSAYDKLLGEIRSTPELRADLVGGDGGGRRRGRAEGADVDARDARSRSSSAPTRRSAARCSATSRRGASRSSTRSPARCCGPAARHGIACPTIERLVAMIAARAGIDPPSSAERLRSRRARRGPAPITPAVQLRRPRRRPGALRFRASRGEAGTDRVAIASTTSLLGLRQLLVVLAVAEHAEVAASRRCRHWIVIPGRISSPSSKPEPLHVEVRQADAVGRVGRVLAVVRGDRLREALEVLGDLPGVRHRWCREYLAVGPASRTGRPPRSTIAPWSSTPARTARPSGQLPGPDRASLRQGRRRARQGRPQLRAEEGQGRHAEVLDVPSRATGPRRDRAAERPAQRADPRARRRRGDHGLGRDRGVGRGKRARRAAERTPLLAPRGSRAGIRPSRRPIHDRRQRGIVMAVEACTSNAAEAISRELWLRRPADPQRLGAGGRGLASRPNAITLPASSAPQGGVERLPTCGAVPARRSRRSAETLVPIMKALGAIPASPTSPRSTRHRRRRAVGARPVRGARAPASRSAYLQRSPLHARRASPS